MSTADIDNSVRDGIREVIADVLELDADEIGWESDFRDELGADSLQGIEILAGLERQFDVTIDMETLPRMTNLSSTYAVVVEAMANR